jgi:hypothetical protein
MTTTAIYYRTLKTIREDVRFQAIQETFPRCVSVKGTDLRQTDIAVIQGWKKVGSTSPHNLFRARVINNQVARKKHVLTIDGNIFDYAVKNTYFRYSINGVFADTGYYFDRHIDPSRWAKLQTVTKISLKPWRKTGKHVLILLQKNSGWTMQETDVIDWCTGVLKRISLYTDRPVVVRIHPSDEKYRSKYTYRLSQYDVLVSENQDIRQDLEGAWCSISYNSSPGAVSAIEGIPVFITDWNKSPARDVANCDLSRLEDPILYDREQWIQRIAMSHFTVGDIRQGLLWKQVQEYTQ